MKKEYRVNLIFDFEATDPLDAVTQMINELEHSNLDEWEYYVEDMDTGENFQVLPCDMEVVKTNF